MHIQVTCHGYTKLHVIHNKVVWRHCMAGRSCFLLRPSQAFLQVVFFIYPCFELCCKIQVLLHPTSCNYIWVSHLTHHPSKRQTPSLEDNVSWQQDALLLDLQMIWVKQQFTISCFKTSYYQIPLLLKFSKAHDSEIPWEKIPKALYTQEIISDLS